METLELTQYIAREALRVGYTHVLPIRHTKTTESKYLTVIYNPGTKADYPKLRLVLRVSGHPTTKWSYGFDLEVRNKPHAGKEIIKVLKQKLSEAKKSPDIFPKTATVRKLIVWDCPECGAETTEPETNEIFVKCESCETTVRLGHRDNA